MIASNWTTLLTSVSQICWNTSFQFWNLINKCLILNYIHFNVFHQFYHVQVVFLWEMECNVKRKGCSPAYLWNYGKTWPTEKAGSTEAAWPCAGYVFLMLFNAWKCSQTRREGMFCYIICQFLIYIVLYHLRTLKSKSAWSVSCLLLYDSINIVYSNNTGRLLTAVYLQWALVIISFIFWVCFLRCANQISLTTLVTCMTYWCFL